MSDLIERLKQGNWENGGSDRLAMADALAVALLDGATLKHADTCLKALQGSLDAALALVSEKLPRYEWARTVEFKTMRLYVPGADVLHFDGRHKSPAIALLIALLQAVQATHPSNEGGRDA